MLVLLFLLLPRKVCVVVVDGQMNLIDEQISQ